MQADSSTHDLEKFLQDLDLNDKVTAFATAGLHSQDDLLKLDNLDQTLSDLGCNNRTRKKIKRKLQQTKEDQANEIKEQDELDQKLKIKEDEKKKERIRKAKGPGKYSSSDAGLNPGEEATGGDMFEPTGDY